MTVPTYDQPLVVGEKTSSVWYRFFQSLGGASSAFATLPFATTVTPTAGTAVRIIATADFTLGLPTGGTDGAAVLFWITASGTPVSVTLVQGAGGYVIPSGISLSTPFTVPAGSKTRLGVQYDATRAAWEVVQYINGY